MRILLTVSIVFLALGCTSREPASVSPSFPSETTGWGTESTVDAELGQSPSRPLTEAGADSSEPPDAASLSSQNAPALKQPPIAARVARVEALHTIVDNDGVEFKSPEGKRFVFMSLTLLAGGKLPVTVDVDAVELAGDQQTNAYRVAGIRMGTWEEQPCVDEFLDSHIAAGTTQVHVPISTTIKGEKGTFEFARFSERKSLLTLNKSPFDLCLLFVVEAQTSRFELRGIGTRPCVVTLMKSATSSTRDMLPNQQTVKSQSTAQTGARKDPSGMDRRLWTDDTGRYTVEAEFIQASQRAVTLRLVDGKLVRVRVERLSVGDRKYVAQRLKGHPRESAESRRPQNDPPQSLSSLGNGIVRVQTETNDDSTPKTTEKRQQAPRGKASFSNGSKEFLRPPDFFSPRGKSVAMTGEPLSNELHGRLTALLKAASPIWPTAAKSTKLSPDAIDTMVAILSDADIVGDGSYCEAGYRNQGGFGWAWGLSMYGAPPGKECKTLMRLYPNGLGVSPDDAADRFGPPSRTKTEREVQHLVYGNVDVIYKKDKYIGAVFFFTR